MARPSVYILYHFFYPDDVISAEHKKDLALGLADRGWDVTVLTSDSYCRDPGKKILPLDELWNGIRIIRIPRKSHDQSSMAGRLLNSFYMQAGWRKRLKSMVEPDVLILGTDPQFSQFMLPIIRRMFPDTKLAIWTFDLYPEALEGTDSAMLRWIARALRPLMSALYSPVDFMIDIGPCMKERLMRYGAGSSRHTVVPWAMVELDEPVHPEPEIRFELFGDAKLGVLYSGTIGQAHEVENFIALARRLRHMGTSVAFCFAGHGNRYSEVKSLVLKEDTNIRFAGFCPIEALELRLTSADMHMISLKQGWEGAVVPSKFFGALAAAKPVLYDGTNESDIGIWMQKYDLGLRLTEDSVDEVAQRLRDMSDAMHTLEKWQSHVLKIYHDHFSKAKNLDLWNEIIKGTQ